MPHTINRGIEGNRMWSYVEWKEHVFVGKTSTRFTQICGIKQDLYDSKRTIRIVQLKKEEENGIHFFLMPIPF